MPQGPTLKPHQVIGMLTKLGFSEVRQRGSHKQFRHADGRGTTVPYHQGRDIAPTLVRKIARDIKVVKDSGATRCVYAHRPLGLTQSARVAQAKREALGRPRAEGVRHARAPNDWR
jgi:predicted RNA binding protein YcfA (HicA-like mRNA interferase family)